MGFSSFLSNELTIPSILNAVYKKLANHICVHYGESYTFNFQNRNNGSEEILEFKYLFCIYYPQFFVFLKPNDFLEATFLHHHFYLPEADIQVQNGHGASAV